MTTWLALGIGIGSALAYGWWRRRCARRVEARTRLTLVRRLNDPAWPHREAR